MKDFTGLKKRLAMSGLVAASVLSPIKGETETVMPEQNNPHVVHHEKEYGTALKVINQTSDEVFRDLFMDRLHDVQQTDIGKRLLTNIPEDTTVIIKEKPSHAVYAAYSDGQDCVIYDDTILDPRNGSTIAHEILHVVQHTKYWQDYDDTMPTEQLLIYQKMMELEARLQDVRLKDEMQKRLPQLRILDFPSADLKDYRQLRQKIKAENPKLPDNQIEKMTRTQFVLDTWQNNRRDFYETADRERSLGYWVDTYNAQAIQHADRGHMCRFSRPDLSVDEGKIQRHHEIMQEFIKRMDIDVPDHFFDTLDQDKSLTIIRSPKILADIEKQFNKKIQMVIMPTYNTDKIGGLIVGKDNSTLLFTPKQREKIKGNDLNAQVLMSQANRKLRD